MPITKSAKKALRQNITRKSRNLKKKEAYKVVEKQIKNAALSGDANEARKLLPKYYKTLDKAAKTNVIKNNKASRKKSRIALMINKSAKK